MIPALLLIFAAVAYRIIAGLLIGSGVAWLVNFAPLAALALCGGAYFPPRLKFTVPLGAFVQILPDRLPKLPKGTIKPLPSSEMATASAVAPAKPSTAPERKARTPVILGSIIRG